MEYIIVSDEYIAALESIVNDRIEEGFIPQGGLAVRVGSSHGAIFLQAMVKQDKE